MSAGKVAKCENCDSSVLVGEAEDSWTLTEAGWMCNTCQEDWWREGMTMATEYLRDPKRVIGGCPKCGSGYYDEHMVCHTCLVNA